MARDMAVVPYDDTWPKMYEEEKRILQSVFGNLILDIQHFGSTSIKGMTAKPIIDVMVTVDDIEKVDEYSNEMVQRGYVPRGEQMISGRRYFVRFKEDGENHVAHIHIYGKGNPHIADELLFRDFLRVDEESFLKYENMKKEVSEKYRYLPGEYQDAKFACVMEIMEKARQYYEREYSHEI